MNIFNIISLFGGLALFLYGMHLMGDGLMHGSSGALKKAMDKVTNSLIVGFFLGLCVTAVIQSSSATIGILQALSITGQLTFGSIYPLLIGICLGDCITPAIVCSIGAKADAKRTGMVHILFNLNEAVLLFAAVNLLHSAGAPTASGPRRSPPTANSSNLQAQAARPCPSRPPADPAAWIGPGRAFYRPASRCTV